MNPMLEHKSIAKPLWKSYLKNCLISTFDFSPPNPDRWVVANVQASGPNPKKDRLISVAATAIVFTPDRRPNLVLNDTFEVIVKQSPRIIHSIDKNNILMHGIGRGAQQEGMMPESALDAFLVYVGNSPIVSFQSRFDENMIAKSRSKLLGRCMHKHWLDLQNLAAVLHHENHRLPLDVWMQRYDIECEQPHQPVAQVFAISQLFMKLWPLVQKRKTTNWRQVKHIASRFKIPSAKAVP